MALVLHNGTEYIEAMLGAFRARAVPFNVNQHYRTAELEALLDDVGPRAVIYHRRYGPLLAEVVDPTDLVLIDVDDGSGVAPLPGSTDFEAAVGTPVGLLPTPSPDDLYLVCTGGTTGRPKAVVWRQADIYVSAMAGAEDATADSIATAAGERRGRRLVRPPAAHARGRAVDRLLRAARRFATVVLRDDSDGFSTPVTVLDLIEREGVFLMSIVGDAYARPLVDELRRGDHDLSLAVRARHRWCGDQRPPQGGPARARPPPHDRGRLRGVGDRRHGLRRPQSDQSTRGLRPGGRGHGGQ